MIQLYGYKNGVRYELDTYKEEPIKLTISAEDITDIPKIESAYSQQFRIPATGNNSIFFNYWYEMGVVDFDVTQKVKAEIHVDGLIFKTGELRLESAYVNKETDNIDFEVVFYGETRDFASELGDIFLNGLETPELNHILSHTLMHQTQLNWGDPNLALNGYLRYGLAVRGYEYDQDGNIIRAGDPDATTPVHGQITLDNTQQFAFTNQSTAIDVRQYTPFIQVKYLIDKIFERTDYSYSADSVFHEDWFRDLYTDGIADATGYTPVNKQLLDVNTPALGYELAVGGEQRINFDVTFLNEGGNFNFVTDEFVADIDDTTPYTFRLTARASDTTQFTQAGFTYRIYKYDDSAGTDTIVANTTVSIPIFTYKAEFIDIQWTGALDVGDKIYATIEPIGGSQRPFLIGAKLQQSAGPSSVLGSQLLKTDVKIVDFLKSILNRFRLVMVPSKEEPLEFVVKPWKDYIATGDNFDWTDKLDNSKDITIKPIFFEQSATLLFEDVEDLDKYNEIYFRENGHVYGRKIYDSKNDLLKDTRDIENIFAPTPVAAVPGSTGNLMIIPFIAEESSELDKDNVNKFLPLLPKPRLLFWNGQQPTTEGFYDEKVSGNEHFVYASFSPYEFNSYDGETWANYPDATTFDLNWNIDRRYWDLATPTGISAYDRYWTEYIDSIYSKEARIITAYFKLDSLDLKDLTFDDKIFINNQYYRVQKVYDAPLNELAVVKVDLVKLLEYVPTLPVVEGGGLELSEGGGGDTPVDGGGEPVDGGGDTPVDGGGGTPVDGGGDTPVDGGGGTPVDGGGEPTATTRYFQISECGDQETGPFYNVYYDGNFDIKLTDWSLYNTSNTDGYAYVVEDGYAYNGYGSYFADGSPNFFSTLENGDEWSKAMIIVQEWSEVVPTVGFITAGYYDCLDANLRRTSEQLF